MYDIIPELRYANERIVRVPGNQLKLYDNNDTRADCVSNILNPTRLARLRRSRPSVISTRLARMLKPFSLEVRVRRWNAEKSKSVRGKFENEPQKKTEQAELQRKRKGAES